MSANGKGKNTHRPHSSWECRRASVSKTHMGYLVQNTTKMWLKASYTLSSVLVHKKAEGPVYWSRRKTVLWPGGALSTWGTAMPQKKQTLKGQSEKKNQTNKKANNQPTERPARNQSKTNQPNKNQNNKQKTQTNKTPPNTSRNQKTHNAKHENNLQNTAVNKIT